MKRVQLFEQFISEKKFKVGDTYLWVGKEWDPKHQDNKVANKKVTITGVEGSKVFGRFDDESKEYIIRDADKFLKPIKESNDFEVEMAQKQLDRISHEVKELQDKIGTQEADLPAWIQDHLSNALNYIQQANTGFYVNEGVEVKISLKHAKEAGDLFDDMFKRYGKKTSSDAFDFKDKHAAYDFVQMLVKKLNVAPSEIDAPKNMLESIVVEKEFSEEEREALAKKGIALPDGSFPIENEADLKNAIHAYGRAKDQKAAAKHIAKRAKALGKSDLIPQSKDFQDSLK